MSRRMPTGTSLVRAQRHRPLGAQDSHVCVCVPLVLPRARRPCVVLVRGRPNSNFAGPRARGCQAGLSGGPVESLIVVVGVRRGVPSSHLG